MSPAVSVVVNNYNYGRYLRDAIDSALGQTQPDVQVVVVDDGSTDDSADVIRAYGDRITPVLKENGGQGSAFNAGFAVAAAPIVIFLDADDRLAPGAAEAVVAAFAARPGLAAAQYPLRHIDGDGAPTGVVQPRRPEVLPDGDIAGRVRRYRCYHWQPTTGNAYAADALRRILPVPEADYRISADAYVNELIPFCGPVARIPQPLADYRVHGGSNYRARGVDGAFFRRKLDQIERGHANLVRLAPQLGQTGVDPDPARALDAAYLGFRLASLLLDPEHHPHAGDRRRRLAARGVVASLANPGFTWWHRPKRAAWFAAVAVAPADRARQLAQTRTPDAPRT